MILIIVLVILLLIKFIVNLASYIESAKLCTEYMKYCVTQNTNHRFKLIEKRVGLRRLAKYANIIESTVAVAEPLGFSQIRTGHAGVIDNFPSLEIRTAILTAEMITEIKGVYKQRLFDCINPLYWIKAIVFLPTVITSLLIQKETPILNKILQFFWWLIGIIGTVYLSIYPEIIREVIEKF